MAGKFGFSSGGGKGFHIANRSQGAANRKQFGVTGAKTGFSGGGVGANSVGETVIKRYERLVLSAGRSVINVEHYPETHPDRGTPEYHNFYKRVGSWLGHRDHFLKTAPWCACCGGRSGDMLRGKEIHLQLDHIYPRLMFPHLESDPKNFNLLCNLCNSAKGNMDANQWNIGALPFGARGTFWHKRPEQLEERNRQALTIQPVQP